MPDSRAPVRGAHVDIEGQRWYRIEGLDGMQPFLVSLASDSDHWLFISSTGALTAGRRDPDSALFPYYTDDRIHDGQDQTGSKTLIACVQDGQRRLWEPLSVRQRGLYRVHRSLAKSVHGNQIRFQEDNDDLGLSFVYSWCFSERFGFVRRAAITNRTGAPVEIELLDGVQNLLPSGVSRRFQLEYSTLADGYKKSELDEASGLGLFLLSSIPTDKAEPSESLRATTVWAEGLPGAKVLLSATQLDAFRDGRPAVSGALHGEQDVRGRRGAYLLSTRITLGAGQRRNWLMAAEVNQDAAAVAATLDTLTRRRADGTLVAAVEQDVARGTDNLIRIVASADGLQQTADELESWAHYSNTLNNVLRGGVPDDGYRVTRADFTRFLEGANRPLAARHATLLGALPDAMLRADLVDRVSRVGDPDLERLAREYLPITFCRRHGDPSRPWNLFTIAVKDAEGHKLLDYQGNWRDIFQNWEALGLSFPGFVEAMIFKFLDCSTADGHNPYHVSRGGFDWEVIDPGDAWSFIGYWGDHQAIYLLKLLERLDRSQPDALARLLPRRLFAYANVPYRIKPYEALLADPQHTIDFDSSLDDRLRDRARTLGADGKLLVDAHGQPVRASLTEKLLVVMLARLANYVPGAGIWMNTQRPEWNDANNALVGHGVSVVTLCYLRRLLAFCRPLLTTVDGAAPVAAEVAVWLDRVTGALDEHRALASAEGASSDISDISDLGRRHLLDALGRAAADYRATLYSDGRSGALVEVSGERLGRFLDLALAHVDRSIRANRRDDGLYHAYNLIKVGAGGGIEVRRLYEMLEGQVAVLSAGLLSPSESLEVIDALRASRLYREDQHSYLLYPDRALPRFLAKNRVPPEAIAASALCTRLIEDGNRSIVSTDVGGVVHFHASLKNAALLDAALSSLDAARYGDLVARERAQILALYERIFDHQSFTGRSGTFYKYEGLGCVYWHMVSKLLLAVQEVRERADRMGGEQPATVARLGARYDEIRAGLGVHKSPELFGAIPTDPHSHTPSFAGAQQPGMTGQVKEDILCRQGDLGLQFERGRLVFRAGLLWPSRLLREPRSFHFVDVEGSERRLELDPGTLAFTTCQVPVIVHRAEPASSEGAPSREPKRAPVIDVTFADGRSERVAGHELDPDTSAAIFERTGSVTRLDVYFAG